MEANGDYDLGRNNSAIQTKKLSHGDIDRIAASIVEKVTATVVEASTKTTGLTYHYNFTAPRRDQYESYGSRSKTKKRCDSGVGGFRGSQGLEMRKAPRPTVSQPAEVMYKPAKPMIPNCSENPISVLAWAGPDRERIREERRDLQKYRPGGSNKNKISMTLKTSKPCPWKPMTWLPYPPTDVYGQWEKVEAERKQMADHEMALELGYETLVGNIQYIHIPGAKDLNRSWQNFLSDDPVEWGFPYEKGSSDRPRCCVPQPYLAHQVKERLWKYPKTRLFQSSIAPEE